MAPRPARDTLLPVPAAEWSERVWISPAPLTGMRRQEKAVSSPAIPDLPKRDSSISSETTTTGLFGTIAVSRGVADRLVSSLANYTDPTSGIFIGKTNSLQGSIDGISDNITRINDRLTKEGDRLRAQFVNLETLLGKFQATSNFLTNQLSKLPTFSSTTSSPGGFLPVVRSFMRNSNSAATKYQHSQVSHADPVQLILMLYDGALARIAQGRQRLQEKDLLQAGVAISKAQAIVGELRQSLNMDAGGRHRRESESPVRATFTTCW